jgi:nucleotide-binding universal stress UspA family protein
MARSLIVHPTDLSAVSEGAFHHALKLALAGGSHLALMHVGLEETEEAPRLKEFPPIRVTLARWGLLPADASEKEVRETLGLMVSECEVLAPDPEAALVRVLHNRGAALVVLGTRGLMGLQRLFQGSFSETLARDARIPALFVPAAANGFVSESDGAVRLANVLIPVAEHPHPSGAITAATGMADLLGQDSEFHLLHVGRPGSAPRVGLPDGRRGALIEREGPVVETIAEVSDELRADLIVMTTAGHEGFLDALRGSTTEGVLRTAKRALLAMPA